MSQQRPVVYLIAGPNGAGKTTFAREFLPSAHVVEFLNADLLAAGLSPLAPRAMAVRSARLILRRWKELLAMGRDFAFESTVSGRTYATMLKDAKKRGYRIRVAYLWLPNVRLSLQRVRQRFRMGGHHVPARDVRRRFGPSLVNFFKDYRPLADEVLLLDAAAFPPRLIARWADGQIEVINSGVYEKVLRQAKVQAPTRLPG